MYYKDNKQKQISGSFLRKALQLVQLGEFSAKFRNHKGTEQKTDVSAILRPSPISLHRISE